MERLPTEADSAVVKDFLEMPCNRKRFDAFFPVCYRQTKRCLLYLQRRGFRLPLDNTDAPKAIDNLAIDVLGAFLRSDGNRPYHVVFDYYERKGIADFRNADADKLYHLFTVLLRGYVRQSLSRLRKQEDPQVTNLKRRFGDILKGAEYDIITNPNDKLEYISLAENRSQLRQDKPLLPYDDLLRIVETACSESANCRQWCKAILAAIDSESEFANQVRKHELISAVVTVNARYVELDGFQPTAIPTPKDSLIAAEIAGTRTETLDWLKIEVLPAFITRGRISEQTAGSFLTATERYLADLGDNGRVDAIPVYFREVMPEIDQKTYLNDYKYTFETIINKSVTDFRERLKKNPTIRKIGGYLFE